MRPQRMVAAHVPVLCPLKLAGQIFPFSDWGLRVKVFTRHLVSCDVFAEWQCSRLDPVVGIYCAAELKLMS